MKSISVLGIDLAKNVFQVCGMSKEGKIVVERKLSRAKLVEFANKTPVCLVAMEACSGAHFWGRKFREIGHNVKLIAPHNVKPYVKTNKSDMADARAIAEAATRPHMRFVPIKNLIHHDMQSWLRVRDRLVRQRTALLNECYGLLGEYGIFVPRSKSKLKNKLLFLVDEQEIRGHLKELLGHLREELASLEQRIKNCDHKINEFSKEQEVRTRLKTVPGVGIITSVAMASSIVDANHFKNGREFAASLGLVPRHFGTGGKVMLGRISKRGDSYLRQLLVHGARSFLKSAVNKKDQMSIWALNKAATRGQNKAVVAIANKNARVILAIVKSGEEYKPRLAA